MFEIIPYNVVLGSHITAFAVNIALVIISDIHGLLWVAGKIQTLPHKRMQLLHRVLSIGLGVSVLTGFMLFWDLRDYLLAVPAFYVKILFVLVLIINAFIIGKHLHVASEQSFAEVSAHERKKLVVSGIVSGVSWVMVIIAAFSLGV